MLVQYLSAKLGVATGSDLARLCGERLSRPARWAMWGQAELVAMATDLAEFVGAAIALQLLFGLDPLPAGGITAVVAFVVLGLRRYGRRPFEVAIVGMLAVVALGFGYELLAASPNPADVAGGLAEHAADHLWDRGVALEGAFQRVGDFSDGGAGALGVHRQAEQVGVSARPVGEGGQRSLDLGGITIGFQARQLLQLPAADGRVVDLQHRHVLWLATRPGDLPW
jgi:hypothetical protein